MATHTPVSQRQEDQSQGIIRRTTHSAVDTAQQTVEGHPISTALVVFGIGFGAGVLLGCALADTRGSRAPAGNSVEAFGHKVLERISGWVPDAVASHYSR